VVARSLGTIKPRAGRRQENRMSASTASVATAPSVSRRHSPTAVPLRTGFWRIVHPGGAVLGYIEREAATGGERFQARRLVASTTRVIGVGEFWSLDDALSCFVV
jgi:hypothetical protein